MTADRWCTCHRHNLPICNIVDNENYSKPWVYLSMLRSSCKHQSFITFRSFELRLQLRHFCSLLDILLLTLVHASFVVSDSPNQLSSLPSNDSILTHVVAQYPSHGEEYQKSYLDQNGTSKEVKMHFNHLVIDPRSGQIYVSAINKLLQLDADLRLRATVKTGKFLV